MGDWPIPSVDDLNKTLSDYVDANIGKYNINYFKPSLDDIFQTDTNICFAAPEYFSSKESFSLFEGFSWNKNLIEGFDNCVKKQPTTITQTKGPSLVPPLKGSVNDYGVLQDQGYAVFGSSFWNKKFTAALAFDGKTSGYSFWNSADTYDSKTGNYKGTISVNGIKGEYIYIAFPNPVTVGIYDLYQRNDGCCNGSTRSPNSWILYGLNNWSNIVQIDARTEEYFNHDQKNTPNTYFVAKPGKYQGYLLIITKVGNCDENSNRVSVQIQEWKMYEQYIPPPPPPVFEQIKVETYEPPIPMIKFDNNLYSPEQCLMNLALKFNTLPIDDFFNMKSIEANSNIKSGLKMKFNPSVYFNDDVSFFNTMDFVSGFYNTLTNQGSSFQANIAPNKPNDWSKPFSCEWFGYVKFPNKGSYTFQLGGDDACYLWIDSGALYDFNVKNAFINNGGLHGTRTKNQTLTNTFESLDSNIYHPIRIQYGQNFGGFNFFLNIKDNKNNLVTNCFYSILNADGSLYFPSTIYYSLVASSEKAAELNRFYCYYYIANKEKSHVSKNKNNAKFAYENIWSFPPQPSNLSLGNSTKVVFSTDGNLYFVDSAGAQTKISNCSANSGTAFKLNVTNEGDLTITQDNGSVLWKLSEDVNYTNTYNGSMVDDAIINNDWKNQISKNYIPSTMDNTQTISKATKDLIYLLSPNGKFKLEISPTTNSFVLKTTLNAYQTKSINSKNLKYTFENDNAFYLYSIKFDMKFNQYFYVDSNINEIQYIPPTSNIIANQNNYIQYESYADPSLKANTVKSSYECQTQCNNDSNCNYYYFYQDQSAKYCSLNTDPKQTPKLVSNMSSNYSIVNPSLNIRMKDLSLNSQNLIYGQTIPLQTYSGDYTTNNFSNYSILNDPLVNEKNMGIKTDPTYRRYLCEIKQKTEDPNTYKTEECKSFFKQGFQNMSSDNNNKKTEGMNGFTPKPSECYVTDDSTGLNKITCSQSIIQNQIQPLQVSAQQYLETTSKIQNNYTDLSKNIVNYKKMNDKMMNTEEYDYNGNTLNFPDYSPYGNHTKTIMDGLDQDISVMVQQQNNIYMVGSITLVTLLICAIFIGSQK